VDQADEILELPPAATLWADRLEDKNAFSAVSNSIGPGRSCLPGYRTAVLEMTVGFLQCLLHQRLGLFIVAGGDEATPDGRCSSRAASGRGDQARRRSRMGENVTCLRKDGQVTAAAVAAGRG
jgi:hypothetical protein